MPDKDQIYIYNADQLSLIKNTFADNDTLLYTIRKAFLQFPLTDVEKGLLKNVVNDEVIEVLKIRMLPELAPTFPIGQIPSILTTLTDDIKVRGVEEMREHFLAKQLEINYLTQQFAVLANPDLAGTEAIRLSDLGKIDSDMQKTFVSMTAYLFLLGYIDPMLSMIKSIAGEKAETPEQQRERMRRNSSK